MGYFYFGYNKEGFQTAAGTTVGTTAGTTAGTTPGTTVGTTAGSTLLPTATMCQPFNSDGNPDYRLYDYTVPGTTPNSTILKTGVKNYATNPDGVSVYSILGSTGKEINSITDIATELENNRMCNTSCAATYPYPALNSDEEIAYSIYESKNLSDKKLTAPPVYVPTFVKQYNSGGELTPLDHSISNPIPWDFDNKSLNPATSLFGKVSPAASQMIFAKCECQVLYNDINKLNYDPNAGIFSYQSMMFGKIVYDQKQALAYQIGEMFVQQQIGELMGAAYGKIGEMANETMNKNLYASKEARYKLDQQLTDFKNELLKAGGNEIDAARTVKENTQAGVYDQRWHDYASDTSKGNSVINQYRTGVLDTRNLIPLSDRDKIYGADNLKNTSPFKWGRDSIKKSPLDIDFNSDDGGLARLKAFAEAEEIMKLKSDRDYLKGKGVTSTNKIQNMESDILDGETDYSNTPRGKATILKRIGDFIWSGRRVQQSAALKANTNIALTLAQKQLTAASVNIAYNTVLIMINALAGAGAAGVVVTGGASTTLITAAVYLNTIVVTIQFLMLAVQLACMTFVGAIFSAFLDYDAVCPLNTDGTRMFNLNDYFENKSDGSNFPGGQVGGFLLLSILQNEPNFGPLLMALGPYICFPNTKTITDQRGQVNLKIKNNLRSPAYYYDPTLSLYNAGSKPRFMAGITDLDPRLFNPLSFHYGKEISKPKLVDTVTDGYPVWVDFANPIMLNKMAQFYYDASRKCLTTTRDGMVSFQYISKFYGLISTTELTCDVQCEITEIKFNPNTGIKICEVIIPVDDKTLGAQYHDRRFYFFKDIGKSTINRTNQRTTEAQLNELMGDNLAIYIVTGCTNVDGTAPDCITYDSKGDSVENPVISLGQPGASYMSPMVDVSSIATKGQTIDGEATWRLPQQSACGKQQKNFTRYNGITNPGANNNDSTKKQEAPVVGKSLEDVWKYAYKDENGKYYYPDSKFATGLSNYVQVTDNLRTTKYWTMVWNSVCKYQDANCQINSKQGVGTILQGTGEGLIGAGFGIGQVQQGYTLRAQGRRDPTSANFNAASESIQVTGGLTQTLMAIKFPGQEMSVSQQISCTYDELTNEYGTFIINGRVMTSQQGYMIDQGPFIKWAPGYTPQIQYCRNQTIELFDCVNSSAVQRFVHIYHTQNTNKIIKKILNITPTLNTGSKWDVTNSTAMCIYNIDVMNYDNEKSEEIPNTVQNVSVGLYLKQNVSNKTCTFVPRCITGDNCITKDQNELYKPQLFVKNAIEPDWDDVKPNVIVTSPESKYDCSLLTNRDKLLATFNNARDGVPKLKSITDSKSLTTVGGQKMCLFKGIFDNVPVSTTAKGTIPSTEDDGKSLSLENQPLDIRNTLQDVRRNLTILIDVNGNYKSDDFPIYYTYTPVPKRAQWFDVPSRVPPITPMKNFVLKPGCENDPIYNDCSNTALIDILVKSYNEMDDKTRIIKVLRAYSPTLSDPALKVCDYDVERMKKFSDIATENRNSVILNRETIRFYLQDASTSTEPCKYGLNTTVTRNNSLKINSGISLNKSSTLGLLKSPYTLAVSYSKNVQRDYFSAVQNYIGYDIPGIITNTTKNIATRLANTRKSIFRNTKLRHCPSKTCMDDTLINAMVNRYNFDAYPKYPSNQNTQVRNSIIRVTKAGTATSVDCQLEIYLRTDFFTDILYNPLPQDTKFYMRNYKFKLIPISTNCKFKVTPFTVDDISKNTMDIGDDAYSLECPPPPASSTSKPDKCSSSITTSSSADYKWVTNDHISPMIRCNIDVLTDPIRMLVINMYNSIVIIPPKNGIPYYNTVNKITKSFTAAPNVLEFKITTKRVYWDNNYNIPYYTGKVNDPDEDAFLVVKWPEETSYEVETGYYWKDITGNFVDKPTAPTTIIGGVAKSGNYTMSTPTIEEFYFPDLVFKSDGIYRPKSDGSLDKVILPYLANDGLTGVDQRQTKRFTCNPVTCINADGSAL